MIHKYTGSCSVHGRDFKSTSGGLTMSTLRDIMIYIKHIGVLGKLRGHDEYIWRYHKHIKVFSTWRDILSTLEGYHDSCGLYHDS